MTPTRNERKKMKNGSKKKKLVFTMDSHVHFT